MADSIYNSESYENNVSNVTPYCDECQTNCMACQDCECEDQNYDNSCGNCESCLSCDDGCQINCMSCNNCECEDQEGECTVCDTCQSCNDCMTLCQRECQCSAQGCMSCNTCQGCDTCQECDVTCNTCQECNVTCNTCQDDQCLGCQASCQICNSKQSYCAKNKQGLTQHIGSMSVPTAGQKVKTKDYTDIATYLNKAIAAGRWSLSPLATEVTAGTTINRSTLNTFISYVKTISGRYLDKKDSKISVSDISTLKGYLDGTNIPDTIPCCENTGYESCVTEQCAASKCQDNYQ